MAAPKWTDFVKAVVPFVVGGASVVSTLAPHHADFAGAAAWSALLVYQQPLANHDIVRLVRTAWGEAAVATIKAYWEAHGNPNHGYSERRVKAAKPQDFEPQTITVKTIQDSLTASRRARAREAHAGRVCSSLGAGWWSTFAQ